jgi:hypothetical protein
MKTIAEQIKWDFDTNGDLRIINKNGKLIYTELSDGRWGKLEWDSNGYQVYWENSYGVIRDNRPEPREDKEIIIEGEKYKLVKQ